MGLRSGLSGARGESYASFFNFFFLSSDEFGRSGDAAEQGKSARAVLDAGADTAHHTSNGCNLRPGDILGTGTESGREEGSEGCLLEKRRNPEPICLPSGELRTFLEDGDCVTMRGYCQKVGLPRIGFGECAGMVVGAAQ